MKATKLLETQHEEVKALLKKAAESSGSEGKSLLDEISKNLLAHMVIEQEIFYPAAAKADLKAIDEGYEEHHVAREMIRRAGATNASNETMFQARVKVLKELIEHHADEEEKEMFPEVEKALGDEILEELGMKMEERFNALMKMGIPALQREADAVDVLSQVGKVRRAPTMRRKKAPARASAKRNPRKAVARRGRSKKASRR